MSDHGPAHKTDLMAASPPATALAKTDQVRVALKQTVRALRSSSRRRRGFDTSAFSRRRDAWFVSILFKLSFVLVFLLPTIAAGVYYGLIASDQYVAEAKFVIQGGEPIPLDSFSVLTGMPTELVVQNTQVVVNYMESPSMARRLQEQVDLRKIYGNENIDFFSRFNTRKPFEKLAKYWKHMIDVSIQMPGGIVSMEVRAFTPEDALRVANAVLTQTEALVNDINDRVMQDNVVAYRREVERAAARLAEANQALERARNTTGTLDPAKEATDLGGIISALKGELIATQNEYSSQLKYVNSNAPQMRAMANRMTVLGDQIKRLEGQITSQRDGKNSSPVLSEAVRQFSALGLEQQIAEQQYVSAASALEMARGIAERREVYLKTFLKPSLPDDARYPKRVLCVGIVAAAGFALWAILCGLISLARNNMA